jgi:predicted dehydrogenase
MKKIKTALLSYGMSGKVFHAPFLTSLPGFELIGAWERSKKLIQQDFSKAISYSSFESLLEDDIDLVIVNTPIETHFEYAKQALLAGKHTLVEKSFTTTVLEAEELNEIAKSKNLKLAVFHNRRWDSDFKTVKDVYSQGILGDLVEAEFHFDRYSPNLSLKSHKETLGPGAGILKDLGAHLIDQALHLFGFPEAVFADIRITRENSLVDDFVDLLLFYSTFRVRLKASFFVREPIPSFILHGKKGSFLKPRGDIQEEELKLKKLPDLINWGQEPKALEGLLHTEIDEKIVYQKVPTLKGNYSHFFIDLYDSIIHNKQVPVTAEDGIRVIKIMEAAIKSHKNKNVISL